MNWIILCLIVAFLYAISAFFDNYITDVVFKNKKPYTVKVANCIMYPVSALIIALICGIQTLPIITVVIALASGIIHSLSSIPYYLGLRDEETTTAATYFQLVPIICFFADILLLGKVITNQQLLALGIIILAPIIIAIAERKGKRNHKKQLRGSLMLLAYVAISSVSTVTFARIIDEGHHYWSLLFWYLMGRACFDITCTLTQSSWRKTFREATHRHPLKSLGAIIAAFAIYTVGDIIFRYTLGITNSSFATGITNASELIFTFILGIVLTLIWPKFGREKLDKRNILAHLIAVVMVITSIILIQ